MAEWTLAQDVVSSWIGDDAPTDLELVQVWVNRAERLLRRKKKLDLAARIAVFEPDLAETVQDVVSNMVQRVFRNPSGTRTKSTNTGPFSESETFGGDQPGYLWITDEEMATLLPDLDAAGGAFSIDLMPSTSMGYYGSYWPFT
jgi:hypothetical protein